VAEAWLFLPVEPPLAAAFFFVHVLSGPVTYVGAVPCYTRRTVLLALWLIFPARVLSQELNTYSAEDTRNALSGLPSDRLGRRDAIATPARLDHGHWWVFFRDKGVSTEAGLRAQLAALHLHPRASARRLRTASPPDANDLPVTPDHIRSVAATGAQVRVVSRWLNAVSVRATADQLQALGRLPAVAGMLPVARGRRYEPGATAAAAAGHAADRTQFSLSYGPSLQQNLPLQIPEMHALGVTGADILIAILDSGFRLTHNALSDIEGSGRIIDTWDFVHGDSSVADDSLDTPGQERHGSQVLSTAAGFESGALIGPAHQASFLLAKTEDIGSETPIEEDHYVAALEWADSLGADILTSSLTYDFGYVMDGTEGISTLAANTAASRGILLVTSMGNSGPGPTSMGAPADAFDIVSVGAVDAAGQIAFFSSRGPTADGRTKPEVVAQGVAVHMVDPGTADGYTSANGTSFSAPLTSGSAALLLESHSDWSPAMLREALMQSGDRSQAPDDAYGWGRFDLLRAVEYAPLGAVKLHVDAVDRYDASDWSVTVTARAQWLRQPEQLTVHYEYVPGGTNDSVPMTRVADTSGVITVWTATIPYAGEQGLRFFVTFAHPLQLAASNCCGNPTRWLKVTSTAVRAGCAAAHPCSGGRRRPMHPKVDSPSRTARPAPTPTRRTTPAGWNGSAPAEVVGWPWIRSPENRRPGPPGLTTCRCWPATP